MHYSKFYKLIFYTLLTFCIQKETILTKRNGGLCISFDDRSIKQWHEILPLLERYDAVCTFYLTQPHKLTNEEIGLLKKIEEAGHEIGCHGYEHVLSESFIKEHGYKNYLKHEILPFVTWANQNKISVESFAYPYGGKFWLTDLILLSFFNTTRSVSFKKVNETFIQSEEYFFSGRSKRLSAISFDTNSNVSLDEIVEGLFKAKREGKVLMIYAHEPVCQPMQSGYFFDIDFLEQILLKTSDMEAKFYRIKDLL